MKVVFKNTVLDILLSKVTLYILLFGSFFLMIAYGLKFSIQIGSEGNYHDISHYQTIIYLHVFLYIFIVAILVNASADLEEEIRERFHEVSLLYIPRIKYFFTKYIAYLLSYIFLLILTGLFGVILCMILFKISPDRRFFIGFICMSINIAFAISLLLLFALSGSSKRSNVIAFFLYLLFSFLNSKTIINWILSSDKISGIISTISPSVFWLQNEWLRYAVGWGFSDKFWQYFLNLSFYLVLLLLLLSHRMIRYECKA